MKHIGADMANTFYQSEHSFHIPVMGTGFSIDTPLRVAKYGISSVISLVDDVLIEQMRKFHCIREKEPYEEISGHDEDFRARRITAYLNLIDRLVRRQVEQLQASPFQDNSEIMRYFEMLPDTPLKQMFFDMLAATDPQEKSRLGDLLRRHAVPGSIDVNIMTKLDRDNYRAGKKLAPKFSDAMAALRGFANSTLHSSIILSAGINQRLYNYLTQFDDFFPDENGMIKKKIVLKVSDYRSAEIQGRYLAKRGLWVSEYRIESGLNCGGHAFVSKGHQLLGPTLDEFKRGRKQLVQKLIGIYAKAISSLGRSLHSDFQKLRVTVQGGIGTAEENQLLLEYFEVDSTGWGTPFLLVPEVINIDEIHLEKLVNASPRDIYLSEASPLGVPFWNLRTSASEEARRRRIQEGKPGSSCPKGFIVSNTEFTKRPICTASHAFQKSKLKHLPEEEFSAKQLSLIRENVLSKSCICHDLAGSATLKNCIDPNATTAVCCGPGIVDFSKIATLEEMVSHIYGRLSLLSNPDRPHMFIRELDLNVARLRKEITAFSEGIVLNTLKYFQEFKANLLKGIDFYQEFGDQFINKQRQRFLSDLKKLREVIEQISFLEE
jgi:hypothetical protein